MFEKSLYDLIRGLRNHKGNERAYIEASMKECRVEIRGQDIDIKATALLKLMYLEMFGYDMSWAAFHVLEVMSSPKYLQKRIGYLGAVQSFRPDTEVLMLATNLLKKDLTATYTTIMSLPIIALPHIITSSLAMSVLSDLLPRLTHSNPAIRKKTIVTLYRLALVYPETLRPTWPKIKERLMDKNEDPSVTAAIVNVICELGWRRPQDFLPLAPRLFELLVDSGNNWMVIKLIKLFATLTPLEPRLVRKLLPPLTQIIRTTPAMSLLYECIDGIIQGGILDSSDPSSGGYEIATLCVGKLRGMIMVEGDPNLKYVALLAFNKIVRSHPYLVAQQEDVIMDCIDSADMSIRLRALDLVVGMVSSENLASVVGRLMRQLRTSPTAAESDQLPDDGARKIEPMADSDDEDLEEKSRPEKRFDSSPPLPEDYKIDVIGRILDMCSIDNYENLVDFDWYIDVLVQLLRNAPIPRPESRTGNSKCQEISERIGDELRTVAVKVKSIRPIATQAAESILIANYTETLAKTGSTTPALRAIVWIIGEYSSYLSSPDRALTALLQISKALMPVGQLVICLQAIPKVFALIAGDENEPWNPERKIMMSLSMGRIIHALEPMATHPDLEVQERAVEFLELLKLAAEASSAQGPSLQDVEQNAPLLLTQAIPALFSGMELNSVAAGAQRNVPVPDILDLDQPINPNLDNLLRAAERFSYGNTDHDEFDSFYHEKPSPTSGTAPASQRLAEKMEESSSSYQKDGEEVYLDPDILARRRAERRERNKDDPFYIADKDEESGASTPLHNILKNSNGQELDIDDIPIMQLDLGSSAQVSSSSQLKMKVPSHRQRLHIAADETLPRSGILTPGGTISKSRMNKGKQSLLQVDSSNIETFSLEGDGDSASDGLWDYERKQREDAEMAKEVKRLEQLRMEMQRASERIETARGVPLEGSVVKKKAKKKSKAVEDAMEEEKPKKKKKKKLPSEAVEGSEVVKPKRKKKAKLVAGSQRDGTTAA